MNNREQFSVHPAIRGWYRGALMPGATTPLELLMIQATRFCNIHCKYCYLPFRDEKTRFKISMLAPLIDRLNSADLLGTELTVLWHAGEPLSLPVDYYEEAFTELARICPKGVQLTHHFQTNATLINAAYIRLIKKWDLQIGVSIDGPEWLNDRNRITRSGKGTFEKTVAGIARLTEADVPFTCIAVLTSESLDYADEIYDFFKHIRCFNVGFNVDEEESIHETSSMTGKSVEEKYKRFLKQIHLRTGQDKNPLQIREFDNISGTIAGLFSHEAPNSTESNPLSIISVDAEGFIYTYSPEFVDIKTERYGDFKIGHIDDINFSKLYETEPFSSMNRDIQQGVYNCRISCSYFDVCGGGTPSNKFFELDDLAGTETNFCRFTRKTQIDAIHEIISDAHQKRLPGNQ